MFDSVINQLLATQVLSKSYALFRILDRGYLDFYSFNKVIKLISSRVRFMQTGFLFIYISFLFIGLLFLSYIDSVLFSGFELVILTLALSLIFKTKKL